MTSQSILPSHTPSPVAGNSTPVPLRDTNTSTSTWAARNPTHTTILCRTPPPRVSEAQKASRKIKRDQKMELTKLLYDAVAKYLDEEKMRIQSLAHAHNVTLKHINNMISSQMKYHSLHKAHLTNALLHAKAKEMNAGKFNLFTSAIRNSSYNQTSLLGHNIH
ncbi:hypothetical protein F4604DRAFT_1565457 [Suillus subluteus]|nr:hypothetical protein F4604DRAFT_1565457 [Suillus subluteus]